MLGISIGITGLPGYGEDAARADRLKGVSLLDAAQQIAQDTPGGVAALAERMGVSPNTLQHKLNPNNTTHHLQLVEAQALQSASGLPYVLYAMAAALGYTVTRARPDEAAGDPVEAFMQVQREHSGLTAAAADALMVSTRPVSPNELRRIEHHANEAINAIQHLVGTVAARVPRREDVA